MFFLQKARPARNWIMELDPILKLKQDVRSMVGRGFLQVPSMMLIAPVSYNSAGEGRDRNLQIPCPEA